MIFNSSCVTLIGAILTLTLGQTLAFTPVQVRVQAPSNIQGIVLNAQNNNNVEAETNANNDINNNDNNSMSRFSFLSTFTKSTAALTLFPFVQNSYADEEEVVNDVKQLIVDTPEVLSPLPPPSKTKRTIDGCPKPTAGKPNNCVATSNIKQLDNYSPPWTYEVSSDEAFARLKGLLSSTSSNESYNILEIDENDKYIKVEVYRNPLKTIKDNIEFLLLSDDKVVIFKSYEVANDYEGGVVLSDFGANKKRVDGLRQRSNGVFTLMGQGLGSADSFDGGKFGKRNGFGGQLKAFYGLQSGQGFESVFEE